MKANLLLYILRVCVLMWFVCKTRSEFENSDLFWELVEEEGPRGHAPMTGVLHETVKRFYSTVKNFSHIGQHILLYGTKSWTFPPQDVNLTLSYPSENLQYSEEYADYILTGVQVVLFLDGSDSRGYITDGGLLQNHISMSFIMPNITRLAYQFWLYGEQPFLVNIVPDRNNTEKP